MTSTTVKNNVWVFGDSFATSTSSDSWIQLLEQEYHVQVLATNGSSEYRIWKQYQRNKSKIQPTDKVIFCHTSYGRMFLKDSNRSLLSRLLPTHPLCDILVNDVTAKKEKHFTELIDRVWDYDYLTDTYNLMLESLKKVPSSLHISLFEVEGVLSFFSLRNTDKGNINHLNKQANMIVYKKVIELLDKMEENKHE
jgi:hypothetical protein